MIFVEYGLAVVALFAAILGLSQYVGPRISSYKFSDDALEIYSLGIRVLRFEYRDIVDVRRISFADVLIGSLTGGIRNGINRPFSEYVLVVRRQGIYRSAVLSPDNALEFIAALKERIAHK